MLVYIGIGGNSPETPTGLKKLSHELKTRVSDTLRFSSVYRTRPFQNKKQSNYLNCCAELVLPDETDPISILTALQAIETSLGRKRSLEKWGDRIIDIDILLIDARVIDLENLVVPHYQLTMRDFFLIPLFELAPSLKIPPDFPTIPQCLERIPQALKTCSGKTDLVFS